MSSPFKTDVLEVVSGGAADPRVVSGTADPTLGFSGPEGSIYLRYGAGTGKIYVKTGAGATAWGEAVLAGGGGGTLDVGYDFGGAGAGRVITADAGAVQIDATTANTQAGLTVNRTPSGAAAAVGIALSLGANANAAGVGLSVVDAGAGTGVKVDKSGAGPAIQANLTHAGARALEVVVTAATTVPSISIVANTSSTTGALLSISKIPGAPTLGDAISVSMGANASGSALFISTLSGQPAVVINAGGIGPALSIQAGYITVANNAAPVSGANTGNIRYNSGTQTFQVSLNGAAYVDLATGVGFTLDIGDAIGSSTVGSALFVGAGGVLQQDNANFFWDDTNNRLGIGTAAAPAFPLDVKSVVGNTAAKFGADWPVALVQGTAFSLGPSIGFSAYYNGGWRFADGPLFNYAGYMEFKPDTTVWNFFRSNQGLGANTLWSSSTLMFQITASNSIRVPNLGVFSPGGNWRGIPLTTGDGTFVLDMASNDLVWDTNTKRLCLGTNPDWAGATISIRKGFDLQLQTRSTVAPGATSGSMIAVSVETTPTGANQRLGEYTFGSYFINIITPAYGAGIEAFAEAAWTAGTSHPSYLVIKTAVAASATPVERMRFPSDGGFQMPASTAAVSAASTGRLRYNSTGQKFEVSLNGAAYVDMATGAGMVIGNAITSATAGSVLFAGAAGVLAQDNAGLNWNTTSRTLGIATNHATSGPLFLQNTVTTGPSGFGAIDSVGSFKSYWGFFNSAYAFTYMQSKHGVLSVDNANIVFGNATVGQFEFGMTAGSAFVSMLNGSSAAVSAASTGRLRYNTTGQKAQWSFNGAAYFDVGTYAAALTAGSVLFANASNQIAQDNANLFWDDTNNRLGLGTVGPNAKLDVLAGSGELPIKVRNSDVAGFSSIDLFSSANAQVGAIGYGNASVSLAHVQGKDFLFSAASTDWVFANATRNEVTVGMTSGSTFIAMENGSSAAVSAASTGRIRYNTTGQKFQVSTNGGAYVDLGVSAVERLSVDGAASPTIGVTFVSGAGTDLTLADGTTDGFIKNFIITGGTGTITPTNLADGNVLTWSAVPANVSFIWDATGATWHVYGNPYNMVTT